MNVLEYILAKDGVDMSELTRLGHELSTEQSLARFWNAIMAGDDAWFAREFGTSEALSTAHARVLQWLAFRNLGCVQKDTPASWVFAAAGAPLDRVIASSDLTVLELLTQWRDQRSHGMAAVVTGAFPGASTDGWAESLAALDVRLCSMTEMLTWPEWFMGSSRDHCFSVLGWWLREGWKTRQNALNLRHLMTLQPTSLDTLEAYERHVNATLPLDLRRVLLEVGDVGMALFGEHIIDFSRVREDESFAMVLENEALGLVLGHGGGDIEVIVQVNGQNRGHVWLACEDEDTSVDIVPLQVYTDFDSIQPYMNLASDMFLMLCRASEIVPHARHLLPITVPSARRELVRERELERELECERERERASLRTARRLELVIAAVCFWFMIL